jgi:uncharacterized membrane protein YfcA
MILGFTPSEVLIIGAVALAICTTVCTLAMEAAVLFSPAFLFLFPALIPSFPPITPNEAIGLAITIEFFGYTSSVTGYWLRRQIDFAIAGTALAYTIPLAIPARALSYFVPAPMLVLVFGLLLVGLAVTLHRAHGRSHEALAGYRPRAFLLKPEPAASFSHWRLDGRDQLILGAAGAFAGLIGIAIGEISNTFLAARKRLPLKISTGTSALILHVTILSALVMNLVILNVSPDLFRAEQIAIPWRVAVIIAPVVIVGGQIGAFVNSRLNERTILRGLVTVYLLTGSIVFVMLIRENL